MKTQWLLLLVVLTAIQCKKDKTCDSNAQLQKAPPIDLDTHSLALVPYDKLHQLTFIKNDTEIVTYNVAENKWSYDGVIDGSMSDCPEYIAKCQQHSFQFRNSPTNALRIMQYTHTPYLGDSSKVKLAISIGGVNYSLSSPIQEVGIQGMFNCEVFDDDPTKSTVVVRGKTYGNVYISAYMYFFNNVYISDSIYYTVNDGVIRAARRNGDVYELSN